MLTKKSITHKVPVSLSDRINRLAWDEAAREQARLKTMFGQARRRAKEKPVSLPKLVWMQDA